MPRVYSTRPLCEWRTATRCICPPCWCNAFAVNPHAQLVLGGLHADDDPGGTLVSGIVSGLAVGREWDRDSAWGPASSARCRSGKNTKLDSTKRAQRGSVFSWAPAAARHSSKAKPPSRCPGECATARKHQQAGGNTQQYHANQAIARTGKNVTATAHSAQTAKQGEDTATWRRRRRTPG